VAVIGVATVALLALALAGALLLSRRLRRQTHGLSAEELRHTFETHEAVLHAVREGLIVLDDAGRIQVANDEAHRLLDLPDVGANAPLTALDLPPSLAEAMADGREVTDEVHLTGDRVLLVNQGPVRWQGQTLGTVTTLRDHTELRALTGELDAVRGLTESLNAQAHEAANRLHVVVSLIETGRADEAVRFATSELEFAQELMDRLVEAVEEPVLAALLLGKAAQASERGVELRITNDTRIGTVPFPARDLVTVVGNLVDNALDAAVDGPPPRWVEVTVRTAGDRLTVRVHDSGPGLEPGQADDAFTRGWSTKPVSGPAGRGLGLALVGQIVRRYGGTVSVRREVGAVFDVSLPIPEPGWIPPGTSLDPTRAGVRS
jgi:two-component system CitB family sensor kinase